MMILQNTNICSDECKRESKLKSQKKTYWKNPQKWRDKRNEKYAKTKL